MLEFRKIERIIHVQRGKGYIKENDAEHSYDLTMCAWFLAQYFPELDRDLVIRLSLVHDLVELHAGDTFAFADKALLDSKQQREWAAYEQLAKDWADFPELADMIAHYETSASNEAKFVYALDKLMPNIVVYLNQGHTWKTENVSLQTLHENKRQKTAAHAGVARYYEALYQMLLNDHDHLFPAKSDTSDR